MVPEDNVGAEPRLKGAEQVDDERHVGRALTHVAGHTYQVRLAVEPRECPLLSS